jgi:hypothetical protein
MTSIIKKIERGKPDKFGRMGLSIITYISENCNEYTAHVTEKGLKVAELQNRLIQLGISQKLIENFKDAIIEEQRESDSFNC